ncbi:adenylate kinase [Trueperella bialowiezensis]|uniref:Adenylate kinase n=1 Tax=Trueperella bialowiezensis TaxID=312285 RepID=A0A448PD29_9ACTO|nr:adenylate kinase [Trueperella bialowiezensis]VEI12829.1 Adenylate kinase [Trueperella bialowiezensis]
MTYRLLIMGPPGAGKGTQAKNVSADLGIAWISSGELFRQTIRSGSELGEQIASYINNGNLVPDEVTDRMVADHLRALDPRVNGFLLDGYPRTLSQVGALDRILAEYDAPLDAVIELEIPDDEIVSRLLLRAEKEGREDDTEDVIRHRIEVYHESTEPLLAVYRERGLLVGIDGMGTIDEVRERLVTKCEAFLASKNQ